ncbi:MAG: DUF5801 repeats-in-toxin domain-containing protein, partial [Sulfurimonas sp.]
MKTVIGTVQGLEGKFFAKDADGNVVELKNGDSITKDMVVFGDKSNAATASIKIAMADSDEIVAIVGTDEQLFDSSLVDGPSFEEGLAKDSIENILDPSMHAEADADETKIDEAAANDETAAGDETLGGQSNDGVFDARDGAQVDVNTDLRNAQFGGAAPTTDTQAIFDYQPIAGDSFAGVDDDGLAGGIRDGDGVTSVFTGTLNFRALGDFPITVGFSAMDGQTGIVGIETVTYSWDAGTETLTATITGGDRDGTDLFIVEMTDSSTGDYRIELLDNVLHPSLDGLDGDNTQNDVLAGLTFTVTDNDGDSSNATLTVNFEDDIPTIEVSAGDADEPTLQVDETDFTTDATASFANSFSNTPVYGADGAGSVVSTFALNATAGNSGLVDTATGENVVLSVNANTGAVEGRTATTNDLVFTVTTDNAGKVTLNQDRAVVHADASDHNDVSATITDTLITLTRTDIITDGDGDTATDSASINIGANISFRDDGPTVDITLNTDGAVETDETDDLST